jgi:hypothetical protein
MDRNKDFEPRGIAEFDSAVLRESVSFTQLVETIYHRQERFNPDEESRQKHKYYHPFILRAFECAYGGISCLYLASNIVAASIITNKGHFEYICPFKYNPEAEKELVQLSSRYKIAKQFLRGTELKELAKNLYAASTYLIQIVDECAIRGECAESPDPSKDPTMISRVAVVSELLKDIQKWIEIGANRNAKIDYFIGIIAGVVLVTILSLLLLILPIYHELLGAFVGGGFGALISVLTRITHGTIIVQYEVGRSLIYFLGVCRPFIGAVMGVALWCLIAGGLLPFEIRSNNTILYFSSIGFLAGFSERWAQDMLAISKKAVSGKDE